MSTAATASAPAEIKAGLPQMGADDGERVALKLMVGENADGTPRYVTARLPRNVIGKKAVVTIIADAAGNLVPVWESWAPRIRVTDDFESQTGLPVSRLTVHAWILAGFVDGWCPSPSLTWVCLSSLARFMDKIKAPNAREFWTPENLKKYREAYETVRAQGLKSRLPHERPEAAEIEELPGAESPGQGLLF